MVARARKQKYDNKIMAFIFDESYDQYKKNLRSEARALAKRLKGEMAYVSIRFFDRPKTDRDGNALLDDFDLYVKESMKSIAPVYRNLDRMRIKLDRERRRIINKGKAMRRRQEKLCHA